MNMFTLLLAAELAGAPIKVNSAHPGWVKTDLGSDAAPMAMPTDPALPVDLVAALARLHADRPGSWLEVLADAVVGECGTDAADLLGMAADRAAAGYPHDEDDGDPEQALANLEADMRALDGPPDAPSSAVKAVDLPAELPLAEPSTKPPRSMDN